MMRVPKKILFILIIAASLLLQSFTFVHLDLPYLGENPSQSIAYDDLPLASQFGFPDQKDANTAEAARIDLAINEFIQTIVDGNSNAIRGIYARDKFKFPVVQQPTGNTGYVSTNNGVVTDFAMARKYGVTGLLAHNYLAGADFFALQVGDVVDVVYGDGTIQAYRVTEIRSYQALSPRSANSNFVDLTTSERLTATQLFKRVYMGDPHLTLQTCIQQGSEDSWGRLFVIAEPVL